MAALVRIAADLGAVLTPHVALQLMDRRRLRPPHDVERHRLMRVTAETADLEIDVAGIERVTERRRGLRRPLKGEHALIPGVAGELVGVPARLSRYADRSAVKPIARFGDHRARMRGGQAKGKPLG